MLNPLKKLAVAAMRVCAIRFASSIAAIGVVQLVHLGPRQRRGLLDGLLSCEGVPAQPA